jgi:GNAT superfamily N-acetyltransferase
MIPEDLDQAFELSKSEGWNQTENDWKLFLGNPVNICLVAEHNSRVAGTATALNHSDKVSWIGMVLVDKILRGQGAGRMLLNSIIERTGHFESVKLDATPAGEPLYKSLGFLPEYTIIRMTNPSFEPKFFSEADNAPKLITGNDLTEVLNYDNYVFGADRSYLLKNLLENFPEKAFCLRQHDHIEGFIMGRDGIKFNYIGPVYAGSTDTAKKLLNKALQSLINKPVALDIHKEKEELVKWLEAIGFVRQRQFTRMYLNHNPHPGRVENQYLICGPELG